MAIIGRWRLYRTPGLGLGITLTRPPYLPPAPEVKVRVCSVRMIRGLHSPSGVRIMGSSSLMFLAGSQSNSPCPHTRVFSSMQPCRRRKENGGLPTNAAR